MIERILFVDDDPNILATYKRGLHKQFHIETARGGEEGLGAVASQSPFAVIVADMRMPGIDGIQFLARVKKSSPDSVRMMLTGYADLETAIEAVNQGDIFRFLTKPCPLETLTKSLRAGIEQYRLITAERKLLENTLTGSVKILTEILSLVNPVAFSRASRIRSYVRHMVIQLQLPNFWQFELAAMLSQIGCVTLPRYILDRIYAGESLSGEEQGMFSSHPSVGYQLLASIPRLEGIAHMIEKQQKPFKAYAPSENLTQEDPIALGSQLLRVALDFDQLVVYGLSYKEALLLLRRRVGECNPQMLTALENLQTNEIDEGVKEVRVMNLDIGMVTYEDIRAKDGSLLVPKGQEITSPILVLLHNFSQKVGVMEPFRVRIVPQDP